MLRTAIMAQITPYTVSYTHLKYRKKVAEAEIGSAEEEAKRIVAEGEKEAARKKKEALVEAKDEIHRMRVESDRDLKDCLLYTSIKIDF